MSHLRIKNWIKYQHYKDRNPAWIKLHYELLSSRDWVMLDDASRVLAVASMLVASRDETGQGIIPADPDYIKRVAYLNKRPDFGPLISCGFLEPASVMLADASALQADARPEAYREEAYREEAETERLSRKSRENVWPDDYEDRFWREYPRKVGKQAAVKKLRTIWKSDRVSWDVLLAAVRLYAKDCEGKDPQYVAHPATWLNAGRWEDEIPEGSRVFAAAVPDPESIAHKAKIAIKMELHDRTGTWPSLDEIERVYAERAA